MIADTKNLTDGIVAEIQEMIKLKELSEGDVLGTESDLEASLGVSRTIIREAVSRLRALGVLESRQRVGLVVMKPDPVALFGQGFAGGLLDDLDFKELSELRYTLEVGAVDMVVRRAGDEHLSELVTIADEFIKCQGDKHNIQLSDDIELKFHQTLLKISESPMLIRMYHILAAYFQKSSCRSGCEDSEQSERNAWEHIMIAEALKERNGERARSILSRHLEFLIR